jgi:hypothetical protein
MPQRWQRAPSIEFLGGASTRKRAVEVQVLAHETRESRRIKMGLMAARRQIQAQLEQLLSQ